MLPALRLASTEGSHFSGEAERRCRRRTVQRRLDDSALVVDRMLDHEKGRKLEHREETGHTEKEKIKPCIRKLQGQGNGTGEGQ